jgi:hypothetical protein
MVSWTGWRGGGPVAELESVNHHPNRATCGARDSRQPGQRRRLLRAWAPLAIVGAICWPPAAATIAVVSHAVLARLQAR